MVGAGLSQATLDGTGSPTDQDVVVDEASDFISFLHVIPFPEDQVEVRFGPTIILAVLIGMPKIMGDKIRTFKQQENVIDGLAFEIMTRHHPYGILA